MPAASTSSHPRNSALPGVSPAAHIVETTSPGGGSTQLHVMFTESIVAVVSGSLELLTRIVHSGGSESTTISSTSSDERSAPFTARTYK